MANKENYRPTGQIPSFANDANMVDPPEAWDGTPTKVEPGSGKRDDGWRPDEKPNAAHMNHLLNELGRWVQLFSDVQIQNWTKPVEPTIPATTANSCNAVSYDDGSLQYVIAGDAAAGNSQLGFTAEGWDFLIQGVAGGNLTWIAPKIASDAPATTGYFFITGTDLATQIVDVQGMVITSRALPVAGSRALLGIWDGGNARFVAAGYDGAATVRAWSSPAAAMTWVSGAGLGVAVNSVHVRCMAADGAGLVVLWGDTITPDLWTSTDGGLNWTLRAPGITGAVGEPQSVAHNAELGIWMMLMNDEVWTSPDGIVWTKVSSGLTLSFQHRCLATRGSLWVAADDVDPVLYYSTDSGVSWRKFYVDDDVVLGATDGVITGITYSEHRREFAIVKATAGGQGQFRRSMSVGTTLLTSEGEVVPTVT